MSKVITVHDMLRAKDPEKYAPQKATEPKPKAKSKKDEKPTDEEE